MIRDAFPLIVLVGVVVLIVILMFVLMFLSESQFGENCLRAGGYLPSADVCVR